jgi:hypothetical protein
LASGFLSGGKGEGLQPFSRTLRNWLFKKIKLAEERERAVVLRAKAVLGEKTEELEKLSIERFGPPLENIRLENLAEDSVENFLSKAISTVETREAFFIKSLIGNFGEEAKALILKASYGHGKQKGELAVREYGGSPTPEELYRIVKNFFLDDTPCDDPVAIEQIRNVEFVNSHKKCAHLRNWDQAGADPAFMCDYLSRWLDGFAEPFAIKHERPLSLAKGHIRCEDRYSKGY